MQGAKGVKEGTVWGYGPKGERGRVLSLSGAEVSEGCTFLFLGFKDVRQMALLHAKCLPCPKQAGNKTKKKEK